MQLFNLILIFVALIEITLANYSPSETKRSFYINYENNSFYKDGKPFQYVSGSVHYFRVPKENWRDRLRKVRAAGLNAVSTYVEWSQHETVPGEFNFSGDLDIKKFIETAQEEDLLLILRPGPYICAERDMGGLPYWLMSKHPDIRLRTIDNNYIRYVERWMNVLLEKIAPLLYGNGGPIILVQVENEYGSYDKCDLKYTIWLRDLFLKHIKDDAVLFTTDGASTSLLKCGKIPDVYATVDFGPSEDVKKYFSIQRRFEPKGPLVNSEYYPGWLTHWGERSMARKSTEEVIETLKKMLDEKANVNFYMFYGGTNFGFTAGANIFSSYQSDVTSYDYDAPISEAGDLTEKYKAIKDVLIKYFGPPPNITVQTWEKGAYGEITLKRTATMFSPKIRQKMGRFSSNHETPITFEALNQNFGYLLYEAESTLNCSCITPNILNIAEMHDFANIYVDGKHVGNMSRESKTSEIMINECGKKLGIMVENLGRVNFGSQINDKKGILSSVLIDKNKINPWNATGYELKDMKPIEDCFDDNQDCDNGEGFVFYFQKFKLPANNDANFEAAKKQILDSFLDLRHLTKGLIFINGYNLGRYWSWRGPQYSLYVPGVFLKPYPENNIVIVLEENLTTKHIKIKFRKEPIFS